MKRLVLAAIIVQLVGIIRPLLGAAQYLASRSGLAGQRLAVIAAIRDAA